jgi:hypothetical protein
MNPDGMSYLDVGREFWHGNWQTAVSAYWSPLYAWLTGAIIGLVRPSPRWEFPLLHLVNFAILMVALFCFGFCWRELLRFAHHGRRAGQGYLWASAYLLFIYVHFVFRDVALVTPDLMVAALAYVAGGLTLRIHRGEGQIGSAALLGIVLGLGYLAKAPMFPFGIAVVLTLLIAIPKGKGAVATVTVTLVVFIGIALPLLVALSITSKRLTLGESARLNQGWWVNGVRPMYRHWQGTPSRPAQHPTRRISDWPEAYEFAAPVPGTYPVWFDPTYWQAGLDASIHPRLELLALSTNLHEYRTFVLHDTPFLTAILLVLLLSQDSISGCLRSISAYWAILLPCASMFLMYAFVHWEPRFTSGFASIAVATVFARTGVGNQIRSAKLVRGTALAFGIITLYSTAVVMADERVENWSASVQVDIAEEVRQLGISPGESVAIIGDGFSAYWAHLSQLRIVAELPHASGMHDSAAAFWSSPAATQSKLLVALEHTGARAVIGAAPGFSVPAGWNPIGKTGLVMHVFP